MASPRSRSAPSSSPSRVRICSSVPTAPLPGRLNVDLRSVADGAKPDVAIAIEGTEISGSQIHRTRASGAGSATTQPSPSKPVSPPAVSPKAKASKKTPARPHTKPYAKATPVAIQTSALWPYELTDELTQQELMMILVAIVSGLGVVGLMTTGSWYLIHFVWHTMREQKLLAALFRRDATARELEGLIQQSGNALPLALRSLAETHVRLVELLEAVDTLLTSTGKISFDETTLVIHGLPQAPPSDDDDARLAKKDQPMTFFHILSAIESLQCLGESVAVEFTALVVPSRWTKYMDVAMSVEQLKKRMLALRKRHSEVQALHQCVVDALERRHVEGVAIEQAKLVQLVAMLRQTPSEAKTPAAESMQLASPLKLRPRRDSKDEFGFFLRSFDELNQQRRVQTELEEAFATLATETRVAPIRDDVHIKKEEIKVEVEVKKVEKKSLWRRSSPPPPPPPSAVASPAAPAVSTTETKARLDGNWTRTLENWVDRADEMEMTHLDEVKRAQYLLEEAKRESFCLMNSSRDAMQSVESLKASLVSLGADPKAAVLTAAEIYSSRSNMLMLTTTLRSVFDEFRKGDIIKMEDRRRRHAQKEREKRERIVAKFRMKQLLLVEKMELQRALEREQQERDRLRREKEEHEAFVKQTKESRKQFVWMITKLDVLIVLVVMAIVFFDSLTRQFDVLKPVCAAPSTTSTSLLGFASSASWWPANSLSLLQCRVEYGLKVTMTFLLGGAVFYIIAQLNLLTMALPAVIAAGLYHVRTEWMNMLFRLPVLLVLYGFNTMVLYMLNQSLSEDDPKQPSKAKRRALLLYVAFPILSVLLSVVVSITIACDHPHECAVTSIDATYRSFVSLWAIAREAYRL
jgi:hypothetical protein